MRRSVPCYIFITMMNLKQFSNHELIQETKRAVKVEREATLAVLDRLHEIYRRSLHLAMGYSSLHEFCVRELFYSDGAAHRRIKAMQLCEELPQAKQAIQSGELSLSNAASLEVFLTKKENCQKKRKNNFSAKFRENPKKSAKRFYTLKELAK